MDFKETNKIEEILGLVPVKITGAEGKYDIVMEFECGSCIHFYHSQDCSENVYIADINGNWDDLLNIPIGVAEERIHYPENPVHGDSETWTFYAFRSILGSVDVRWIGASNGYYSERVSYEFTPGKPH